MYNLKKNTSENALWWQVGELSDNVLSQKLDHVVSLNVVPHGQVGDVVLPNFFHPDFWPAERVKRCPVPTDLAQDVHGVRTSL